MTKMTRPAHDDPHNSVDLFDTDRRNQYGGLWCVAPAILPQQVEQEWQRYLADRARAAIGGTRR